MKENYIRVDRDRQRVIMKAEGFWTLAEAEANYADMQRLVTWSTSIKGKITLLEDLETLAVHSSAVSNIIENIVELMKKLPIDRYALIVKSELMRMQCRRLLAGIEHKFFDDAISAYRWLGWEDDYNVPMFNGI